MKTEACHHQACTSEIITVEQLAERLQVSRATLFTWMQRGILALGRHYFKQGRVLRFVWSCEMIAGLVGDCVREEPVLSPGKPSPGPQRRTKESQINWEYCNGK